MHHMYAWTFPHATALTISVTSESKVLVLGLEDNLGAIDFAMDCSKFQTAFFVGENDLGLIAWKLFSLAKRGGLRNRGLQKMNEVLHRHEVNFFFQILRH